MHPTDVHSEPRLLTSLEVAQRFGIHPSTVWRWRKAGRLPSIALPSGRVAYSADEIDRIVTGKVSE